MFDFEGCICEISVHVYSVVTCRESYACSGKIHDLLNVEILDQRICIQFCPKNRIKYSNFLKLVNIAFGESALNKKVLYERYKRFHEGHEKTKGNERHGRPSTSTADHNVEKLLKIILGNGRNSLIEDVEWSQQQFKTAWMIHNRRWNMGFRTWGRNYGSIVPKEASRIAKNLQKSTSSLECKHYAHCVLRFRRHNAPWVLDSQSTDH